MVDYIVVGLGLAGMSFCEVLRKNQKSFFVINDDSQTSSKVAGGLSNPVILKRFTLAWKADKLLPYSKEFYQNLEKEFHTEFLVDQPILRRLSSIEEQNLWFEASDKETLRQYLSPKLVRNANDALNAPYDFGRLDGAYRLRVELLLDQFKKTLDQGSYSHETFVYGDLKIDKEGISYQGVKAKNIVFAEGFGLKKNPFFNYLPMQGSKGEYLFIRANELKERNAVKSSIFIIPLANDQYMVGANYNPEDKDNIPSENTKNELLGKLEKLINCPYKVIGHVAGVRPTVKDRRPLIGKHPSDHRMGVLNGFGSHGVMIAPWASHELFQHFENGKPLDGQVDIGRFANMFEK